MVSHPQLKLRCRHDLRLHAAHVAANGDQVLSRTVQQMMASQAESVYLICGKDFF